MLSKVCGETYPKTEPILWLNMRQEPSLYVNGEPVCARPPNKVRCHVMIQSRKIGFTVLSLMAEAVLSFLCSTRELNKKRATQHKIFLFHFSNLYWYTNKLG